MSASGLSATAYKPEEMFTVPKVRHQHSVCNWVCQMVVSLLLHRCGSLLVICVACTPWTGQCYQDRPVNTWTQTADWFLLCGDLGCWQEKGEKKKKKLPVNFTEWNCGGGPLANTNCASLVYSHISWARGGQLSLIKCVSHVAVDYVVLWSCVKYCKKAKYNKNTNMDVHPKHNDCQCTPNSSLPRSQESHLPFIMMESLFFTECKLCVSMRNCIPTRLYRPDLCSGSPVLSRYSP